MEEQEGIWGNKKLREREQEDRETRKNVPKITEVTRNGKREQYEDREQGTQKRKKIKYRKEPDTWGEQESTVEDHPPAPNWELPPKEQVLRKRKVVQSSIKKLLLRQVLTSIL